MKSANRRAYLGVLLAVLLPAGVWGQDEILGPADNVNATGTLGFDNPLRGLFGEYLPRLAVRHVTEGAGYEYSYSSFEGWVPVLEIPDRALTYVDARAFMDNDERWGFNGGVGQRIYLPRANRVFGAYGFFDNQDTGIRSFNQISGGIETLGELFDARANVYVPINDRRRVQAESFSAPEFFEQNILLTRVSTSTINR